MPTVDVDISKYPTKVQKHPVGTVVTLGDMHGNAMKYIWELAYNGVLELENPEKDLKDLWELYEILKTKEISGMDAVFYHRIVFFEKKIESLEDKENKEEALKKYSEIIGRAKINPDACRIRLLGDFIADRGNNDWMTLLMLKKLKENGVKTEITASSHDMFFLNSYFSNDWRTANGDYSSYTVGMCPMLDAGLVSKDEVKDMMEQVYLPDFKLLSYALTPDGNNITLFMYAPNNLGPIKDLAKKLSVQYNDDSAKELAETIDAINKAFISLRTSDQTKFHGMIKLAVTRDEHGYKKYPYRSGVHNPLSALIWNYGDANRITKAGEIEKLPEYVKVVVHGHTGPNNGQELERVENLDNYLGKGDDKDNKGEYVSHDEVEPAWGLRQQNKEPTGKKNDLNSTQKSNKVIGKEKTLNLDITFKNDQSKKSDPDEIHKITLKYGNLIPDIKGNASCNLTVITHGDEAQQKADKSTFMNTFKDTATMLGGAFVEAKNTEKPKMIIYYSPPKTAKQAIEQAKDKLHGNLRKNKLEPVLDKTEPKEDKTIDKNVQKDPGEIQQDQENKSFRL